MFKDFEITKAKVNGVEINYRIRNCHKTSENAILFLHGFPQTHVMWSGIADEFPESYPIICPDLRGYGNSEKPSGVENFSFRKMAEDQFQLMFRLGFEKFHIVGHDRGGRVAHRMALDLTDKIKSITLNTRRKISEERLLISKTRATLVLSMLHKPQKLSLIGSNSKIITDLFGQPKLVGL
ncbi:alpha/beta hydrolase [Paracoccaceae bacterium]|nr:alpha/beta hydrolase [Paracoccaceae bacterium]